MDALSRLANLSAQMDLEPAEDTGCHRLNESRRSRGDPLPFISHAQLPNGKQITLLKSLLTSACERNCFYCPFRAGRDFRRETFKPVEMAATFMGLHRAGVVEGIFLSSGIAGGSIRTQDQLIDTAEILRKKLQFKGYIHLKLMPGAQAAQIERAMQLSNRVSVNLEAPNTTRLEQLAPRKDFFDELVQPLRLAQEIRRSQPGWRGWNGHWPSLSTQFVVGAVGESDLELLDTTSKMYAQYHLRRAYFSAFKPIEGTPFEDLPAESPIREHRLYQASFLLRDYGFSLEDMPFTSDGSLPRQVDPKRAWADAHLAEAPLEINTAGRHELLRIPGIGPKGAEAILNLRRLGKFHELSELHRAGVNPSRAAPYILVDGRRPAHQLSFWD